MKLNDAQIAGVMTTANLGEIAQNIVAVHEATDPQAQALATDFVEMHKAAQVQLDTVLKSQNLVPAVSDTAIALQNASHKIVKQLLAADPASFDTVWVQSQIEVHEQVLQLIDSTLLPNVQNDQLRAQLVSMRALVADHLARARALAESLHLDVDAGVVDAGG